MQLSEIFVYPVKSAGGIPLAEARLDEFGIVDDRRWMVVDEAGNFLTQREEPRLALLRPALEGDALVLRGPDLEQLRLPRGCEGPELAVRVWDDEAAARDCGPGVSEWLAQLLGRTARLVHLPAGSARPLDPRYASDRRISFVDAFPLLVIGEASLGDLNRRLAVPLPMNRFRPNLVVSGSPAYAEDSWTTLRIGSLTFRGARRCARCVTTTVDQETAETGKEPLRTLATYRRMEGKVFFGRNLIHEDPGIMRLGDLIVVRGDREDGGSGYER